MSNSISILIMVITLIVAYGLDFLTTILKGQTSQTLNPSFRILGQTGADLIFGILMILFTWLVLIKMEHSRLRAVIYILSGAIITFYLPFLLLGPYPTFPRVSFLYRLHSIIMDLGPGSFLVLTSAYIFIIGWIDIFKLQRIALKSS